MREDNTVRFDEYNDYIHYKLRLDMENVTIKYGEHNI